VSEPVVLGMVVLPFFRITKASDNAPDIPLPTPKMRSVAENTVVEVGV